MAILEEMFMATSEDKILKGNCYIENRKDGPCAVGFKYPYEDDFVIPDGVEWIGDWAFDRYYGMETVVFPDSLDYIGKYAFCRCSSLRTVTLGKNVNTMHDYVFSECHQLTEADLSQSKIEILPAFTFKECKKLHTIKLPKTMKKIEAYALCSTPNVISLELNEGLKVIEEMNFEGMKQLSIINLPSTVIHIPDLHGQSHIKTVVLSRDQHDKFAEYLPKDAKIIYKD